LRHVGAGNSGSGAPDNAGRTPKSTSSFAGPACGRLCKGVTGLVRGRRSAVLDGLDLFTASIDATIARIAHLCEGGKASIIHALLPVGPAHEDRGADVLAPLETFIAFAPSKHHGTPPP